MDIVNTATRSRMMAGIRSKDTRPEMLVRRFLHANGFRYRLHVPTLPGRPDIVLARYRIALFVHGCFWHQHSGCRFATIPASNTDRWLEKFAANKTRDEKNIEALVKLGWQVIVVWECGLGVRVFNEQSESLLDAIRQPIVPVLQWPTEP